MNVIKIMMNDEYEIKSHPKPALRESHSHVVGLPLVGLQPCRRYAGGGCQEGFLPLCQGGFQNGSSNNGSITAPLPLVGLQPCRRYAGGGCQEGFLPLFQGGFQNGSSNNGSITAPLPTVDFSLTEGILGEDARKASSLFTREGSRMVPLKA